MNAVCYYQEHLFMSISLYNVEYTKQPTTPSAEELQLQLVLGVSLPVLVVLATSLLIVIAVILKVSCVNNLDKLAVLLILSF